MVDLHGITNANIWVVAFMNSPLGNWVARYPEESVEDTEHFLVGWFANAIESGKAARLEAATEYDVLDSHIHAAIGQASVCWEEGKVPHGVFDDKQAREIAADLRGIFNVWLEKRVQEAREDERRKLLADPE